VRINHNISALNAWRSITNTQYSMSKTLERLSSGLRINRAGDDAAGLAISEKMRGQIRGLNMAIKNAQDAISLIQTAEGSLTEVHSILQRMRELAVQASQDTNTAADRQEIQNEIDQLIEEIDRIRNTTEFNTQRLLDGSLRASSTSGSATVINPGTYVQSADVASGVTLSANSTLVVQVADFDDDGDNDVRVLENGSIVDSVTLSSGTLTVASSAGTVEITVASSIDSTITSGSTTSADAVILEQATVRLLEANSSDNALDFHIGANELQVMRAEITDMSSTSLGVEGVDVTTQEGAERAISTVDAAIQVVSRQRSSLGAYQSRLEHTVANLGVAAENLTAAESRIRDADMAKEIMEFTKQQILLQSANAMLAQANAVPQNVLQLMR